jgi:sugar-specific transcriptional regulator TrmB
MIDNASIELFVQLGLTVVQAEIYLALVKTGIASEGELSILTGISQLDVKRVLNELVEIGLVHILAAERNFFS